MAYLVHKYSGKATPEKSNFTQTCNLLSQYLKGRGNLVDINAKLEAKGHEASRAAGATLNLLPKMENSAANNIKSVDFFPQFVGNFASPNPTEDFTNKNADLRKSSRVEPATAQMTIFYAGKVIVLDDFPADKAKEIVALATKGSSNVTTNAFKSTSAMDITQYSKPQANGSDLPIARRASLHRFLEKRKDRVAAKAPYKINHTLAASPKPEERNLWLDLECQSSKQLELTLQWIGSR